MPRLNLPIIDQVVKMKQDGAYKISYQKGFVLITLTGPLTVERVLQISREILNSALYRSGLPQIWDASATDLSLIDDEIISEISAKLTDLWSRVASSKVGVVSENNINLGLIRLFKEYYDDDRGYVRAFESLQDAENWVLAPD